MLFDLLFNTYTIRVVEMDKVDPCTVKVTDVVYETTLTGYKAKVFKENWDVIKLIINSSNLIIGYSEWNDGVDVIVRKHTDIKDLTEEIKGLDLSNFL